MSKIFFVVAAVVVGLTGCGSSSKKSATSTTDGVSMSATTSTTAVKTVSPPAANPGGITTPSNPAGEGSDSDANTGPAPTLPAGAPDPCKVLSVAEIQGLLGNAVKTGAPSGTGQSCNFAATDPTVGATLMLSTTPGDTHEKFVASRKDGGSSASAIRDLAGIGDEAFAYAPSSGSLQSAEARKGTYRLRVLVTGSGATPAKAENVLKALVAKS